MSPLGDEGLARFDEAARAHVADGDVPGVVALVAQGEDTHVVAAGSLSIGGAPVERDSQFRIASMTKPMTAAAALALVAEGRFGLDDSIEALVPELADRRVLRRLDGPLDDTEPARRAITVRDLLTFTFGFGVTFELFGAGPPAPILEAEGALGFHTLGPPQPARQPVTDVWIERLGSLPLLAQPGDRWLYNTGASVLGVLLARAAGTGLGEVLASRLFDPLGMKDTSFVARDPGRLATAYAWSDDGPVVADPPEGAWSRPPPFPDGAAGLVATVDDVHGFATMLLRHGDGLLPGPLVDEMRTNQLSDAQRAREGGDILLGRGWGFCQAVVLDGPRAGAFGWDGGLGTTLLVDPARDGVVVVLTQRLFTSPAAPRVHVDLQAAAYEAMGGHG